MGKRFEVDTFNKLLHGWAQKGNIMSIKFLWNLLNTEGLEPDMGTYAALLHGYGKYGNKEGVQTILDEMKRKVSKWIQFVLTCACVFSQTVQYLNMKVIFAVMKTI